MIFKSFKKEEYFVYHYPNIILKERPVLKKITEKNGFFEII